MQPLSESPSASEEAANSRLRQILETKARMKRRGSEEKSAMSMLTMLEHLERSRPSEQITSSHECHTYCRADLEEDEIAMLVRRDRQRAAERFRSNYTYGSSTLADGCNSGDMKEKKTCIWSSGTYSWLGKSSGIMWVAVHGMNSICVVTKDEKLDVTRLRGFLKCTSEIEVLQCFRGTVVSEIEDLADPSSGLRQLFDLDHNIQKPFGVVSVIPGTNKVHEENGHEVSSVNYDGKKAIEFLEEKMKSDSAFSFNETIEAAISAFQHLFHRKFKAKEIRVCVWRDGRVVRDLHRSDVKKHLSVVNA